MQARTRGPGDTGWTQIQGISSSGFPETERIMAEAFTQEPFVHRPPQAPATAADVMRPAPATIESRGHVAAAAYLMKHAGMTALVVVDDDQAKRPVGIITEADIVQAVADGKDVNNVRIRALITAHPTVIDAGTSIRDAARSMVTGHFRYLPVVGEAGLVGMVDITDVCAALRGPPQDDLMGEPRRAHLKPHDDLQAHFPYLGPPNPSRQDGCSVPAT